MGSGGSERRRGGEKESVGDGGAIYSWAEGKREGHSEARHGPRQHDR